MNRRVVHIASGREWRGGQQQVWLLARALARDEHIHQTVITGANSTLAHRLEESGLRVHGAAWWLSLDPRAMWALWSECRSGHHIIHAHDSHALLLAVAIARFSKCPLVVTRRTAFPIRRPWTWQRAHRVIAISNAVAQTLLEAGVPGDRVEVIHSGIDLDRARGVSIHDPRGALGLAPDTPLAVVVGALDGAKGHDVILETATCARPRLPSLHWVLAGEGPDRRRLEGRIASLGLGGIVHLLGHVPRAEAVTRAADVMVAAPRAEGLGVSILEALAVETPVVATDVGGIPEILAGGAGVLVPGGSPADLAGAVVRILTDEDECRALVRRGTERVAQFSDALMARAVASVYRSLT